MIYDFADCTLDANRVVLTRGGDVVPVEPQVYDLLLYLVENRGSVRSKEQLLDDVWGDRFVSESALTTRIKSLRRAVGDSGASQHVVRTVHGKGYEFVAEVVPRDPAATVANEPTALPQLPQLLVNVIGREETIKQLTAELGRSRLVTLIGPGGVGKTTLGLKVCTGLEQQFPDGVWPIQLVTVGDPAATIEAVATALDVHARQSRTITEAVVDVMRPRRALLFFDNCEHVAEPVSDLVEELLLGAPDIAILATSREPLGIPIEQVWPVHPLAVSLAEGDLQPTAASINSVAAVQLFVDRAVAADPQFELTDTNAPAVAEICRRLDGVPLAIELAAARVRALDVSEIATRLDERFRLLKGVRRGADPRHQALEDTVRWSFDLLEPDEQQLFSRLSVFAGPFDLATAESVCELDGGIDVVDCLTRLADRSMVVVRHGEGSTHYEMLESLRAYGSGRLNDAESVGLHRAHSLHFSRLSVAVAAGLASEHEARWSETANRSFADLRAAVAFAVQVEDPELALQTVCSVREYGMRSMRYEVLAWADAALAVPGASASADFAVVRALRSYGLWVRGDFELALEEVTRALEEAAEDDHIARGLALRTRANVQFILARNAEGLAACGLLLEAAEASGHPSNRAHANYMASCAHSSLGQFDAARELAAVAHEAAAATQAGTDAAGAYFADGLALSGDDEAALAAFDRCDRLAAAVGNRWMSAFARTELNSIRLRVGDTTAASRGMAEVLDTWFRSGDWSQQWLALSKAIPALAQLGRVQATAELVGAVERHASLSPPPSTEIVREETAAVINDIRRRLGEEQFTQLAREGAALPVEQVLQRTRQALTP